MEALFGRDCAEMVALLGRQDLQDEIASMSSARADTHLHVDLDGRDPDDGMTAIAYEKGYLFLRMLEEHRWDASASTLRRVVVRAPPVPSRSRPLTSRPGSRASS